MGRDSPFPAGIAKDAEVVAISPNVTTYAARAKADMSAVKIPKLSVKPTVGSNWRLVLGCQIFRPQDRSDGSQFSLVCGIQPPLASLRAEGKVRLG